MKKMTAALLATTISWLFFTVAGLAPRELEKFWKAMATVTAGRVGRGARDSEKEHDAEWRG